MIPLSMPNFEGNERKYVDDAIEKVWVSTAGAYVERLEEMMAEYLHVDEVAACQSGTSAIHLSMIEAGVQPCDMVIVPTITFIAAVNPVRYQYAEPIFMDCDDSLCMDPEKLEKFCQEECEYKNEKLIFKSTGKHIKALVVVHVFGNLADMERIMAIAEKYGLMVIEDATEALGTKYTTGKYAGRYAGTIGDFGAFSYNGNKIITTGGGGAVTAKSTDAVRHMRYLSTQAKDDQHYYIHNEIGYNYRMTNVQAAIGVAQMESLTKFIEVKNKNYELYKKLLADCNQVKLMEFRNGTRSNKWFYSLNIDTDKVGANLREIITSLEKRGISTRAIWGLIYQQAPYKESVSYRIEKALYYSGRIINIPCSTNLKEEEINYVAEQVKEVLRQYCKK
jgi:perosamine synthetase